MKDAAAIKEYAEWAKVVAHDPKHADKLPEIVLKLAGAILDPPKKRGRPFKPKLEDGELSDATSEREVKKRTYGHVAISKFAHIVNARAIVDGRAPKYPGYGDDISKDEATRHLKERRLFSCKWQSIGVHARRHVVHEMDRYGITEDHLKKLINDKFRQRN